MLQIEQPGSASTAFGSAVHKLLERWSRYGEPVADHAADPRMLGVASLGLPFAPHPSEIADGTADVEREFVLYVDGLEIPFYGLIDVLRLMVALIGDYKTTSDFKWMKSEYELKVNPQAVIYSLYALSVGIVAVDDQGREYVDCEFYYLRTKGAPQSNKVPVRLYKNELLKTLEALIKEAKALIYEATLPFEEVPYNLSACGDFGGCFMRDTCHAAGLPVFGQSIFDNILDDLNPEEEKEMALPSGLASMQAARKAVSVTAATVSVASIAADLGEQIAAPPAPAAPSPPKFGTPSAPKPVQAPKAIQAPTMNPPDGFPANVPGTPDGPTPPAAVESKLMATLEGQVAAEGVAKETAKAAKAADKPKTPLVGKKAKEPDAAPVTPVDSDFYGCHDKEISEIARTSEPWKAAAAAVEEARTTLSELIEAKDEVTKQIEELLAADKEDEADDLKAEHDKLCTKAERALTKALEAKKAAGLEAVRQATELVTAERARKEAEKAPEVAASPATTSVTKAPAVQAGGRYKVLCINCRPQVDVEVTFWEDFIAPFIKRAEKANKVEHFRMIGHDANLKVLVEIVAGLKAGTVDIPDYLIMHNYSAQSHGTFIETLKPLFNQVFQ